MATTDQHWRVRMTAVQTLGRLGAAGVSDALKAAVDDEHPRVRAAAELALHRLE
jgi:HEAT repeat protein